MKRKFLILLASVLTLILLAFGISACDKSPANSGEGGSQKSATILKVEGASIDDDNILMIVPQDTENVRLADKVVCSEGSYWQLFSDALGETEIPTKVAADASGSLLGGDNTFYIVVTSQDRTQTKTYVLNVHKQHLVRVDYMVNGSSYETKTILTGTPLTEDYDIPCTLKGCTFNYWEHTEKFGDIIIASIFAHITFTANITPDAEMVDFDFTPTQTTCNITGLKNKSVTNITIPECVTSIGSGAFSGCSELTSITIPDSVTSIGNSVFDRVRDTTAKSKILSKQPLSRA